jgi:high affinity Mn2+ porin
MAVDSRTIFSAVFSIALLSSMRASSQTVAPPVADDLFSLHFQATVATQAHPGFGAAYSGQHSLNNASEAATSVVMDVFAGMRLWKGAEIYFQPELAGGRGLSSTEGIAAFSSGEVYRVGDPEPTLVPGRIFYRQEFGFGGGSEQIPAGVNQIGATRDRDRLTFTIGKITTTDIVDNEQLSNDPHTRFLSWGLFASGAFDYAADTRGYTWGVAADLKLDWWSVRAGMFLEPKEANGLDMEWNLGRSRSLAVEGEVRWAWNSRPGAARLMFYLNTADMGNYRDAINAAPPGMVPDVIATRAQGRTKAGFAASADQQLGETWSGFARLSWNDGQNETWAYTEIDQSLALGFIRSGAAWKRPTDEVGIGLVVSGISAVHREYLRAGGLGFILGDGGLDYGLEILGELYYRLAFNKQFWLIGTYQPVIDPGYNRARGPVNIFSARLHVAF